MNTRKNNSPYPFGSNGLAVGWPRAGGGSVSRAPTGSGTKDNLSNVYNDYTVHVTRPDVQSDTPRDFGSPVLRGPCRLYGVIGRRIPRTVTVHD